jgi:hypothetical protein
MEKTLLAMEQLAEMIAKDSAGGDNPRRVLARKIETNFDPPGLHSNPFRASRGITSQSGDCHQFLPLELAGCTRFALRGTR